MADLSFPTLGYAARMAVLYAVGAVCIGLFTVGVLVMYARPVEAAMFASGYLACKLLAGVLPSWRTILYRLIDLIAHPRVR